MSITIGAKYDSKRSTKEVAEILRAEVRDMIRRGGLGVIKPGTLPHDMKISVRYERYSGGSSLHLTVTALPASWTLLTPEYLEQSKSRDHIPDHLRAPRFTESVRTVIAILTELAKAYQSSDIDSMSDLFNVNFHLHVEIDASLVRAAQAKAELVPPGRPTEIAPVLRSNEPAIQKLLPAPPPEPAASTVSDELLPPIELLRPRAPEADPDVAEQRLRALRDELTETRAKLAQERAEGWRLVCLLNRVRHAALDAAGSDLGDEIHQVVREHPISAALSQVACDMVSNHPAARYVSTTASMCDLAEERLKAAGYELPEGFHIDD